MQSDRLPLGVSEVFFLTGVIMKRWILTGLCLVGGWWSESWAIAQTLTGSHHSSGNVPAAMSTSDYRITDEVASIPAGAFQNWLWQAGADATLLRPYAASATGLTTMQSDGNSREDFVSHDFRSQSGAGYRLWFALTSPHDLGFRARYWTIDPNVATLQAQPAANGFGMVSHPVFGNVDISTSIPTDRLEASSSLLARTAQTEAVLDWRSELWIANLAMGVEYAEVEQAYQAKLTDAGAELVGQIDNQRRFQGVGPTMAIAGEWGVSDRIGFFGGLRTSLLLGRDRTMLNAGEDLDLPQPLRTTRLVTQDRVIPRIEAELGICLHLIQRKRFGSDARITMEAQDWLGVGSATNEPGNLGLFGIGLGLQSNY